MKKILSLFIVFTLLFGFCACKGNDSSPSPSSSSSQSVSKTPDSSADATDQSDTGEASDANPSQNPESSVASGGDLPVSEYAEEVDVDTTYHIIIMSDVHLCHLNWYGIDSPTRMQTMVDQLNAYNLTNPYSNILFLGDYSLDFWAYQVGGSYLHNGVSNTSNLIKNYFSQLSCQSYYMIPGNHEQYSSLRWKEITGFDRQYSVVLGGWLFIMLDNFAGYLDPDYDNDGYYSQSDVNFIKKQMEKYPDIPVVLCAHYFSEYGESSEFKSLVKDNDRIAALFCGHDHSINFKTLGDEYGNKVLFHDGNFSYASNGVDVADCMWGWCDVYFNDTELTVQYYTPQNTIYPNGGIYAHPAGVVQTARIPLKK